VTLPAGVRLGHVTLQVANLERSLAFYEGLLGLNVLEREERTVRLGERDGAHLFTLVEHPGATLVPRRGRLGLYHVALLLPSRAALGQFLRHVGASGIHIGMSDHLFSEALYLTDPDGLGLEVYADRPRDTWPREAGELVGASLPLDVESVLAAGGEAPFTGIPEGSVIGHVHFYVDDLARASRFYEQALGLEKMTSLPSARFVSAGGYHHHVGFNTWALGAALPEADDARLLEWQLVLPSEADVQAAAARLEGAGFTTERADDGSVRAVDPWRTTLRLYAAP
jgi:catechol 2,3-dioxygenase